MPHYKRFFDNDYIGSFDLGPGDHAVVIERVEQGELQIPGTSAKERKPLVRFVGKKKPMVLNATNAKTIAAIYGTNTDEWVGKPIAIYATKTTFAGEEVDCIRVRPTPPAPRTKKNAPPAAPEPPPEEETSDVPTH